MNTPNPFVPQGSLLEQHKRRSRMKLGVFCAIAISVCGLSAMLIQGCKREQAPTDNQMAQVDTNPPMPMLDTNPPVIVATNPVVAPVTPVVVPAVPEAATGETYVVVKGDTLGKIATAHHVTLKALQAANPNVVPTKLKIGDKLTIPASTGSAAAPSASASTDTNGGETYTVKSGDTMSKIAKANGVSLKALEAANPNVEPSKIKVGQKLKLPVKAEAPAATTVNTPPPVTSPAPIAPAPGTTPNGQ
jgi:LysM repeat protein